MANQPSDDDQPIAIRRAMPEDDSAIVELAGAALGWEPDDPNAALFAWKHRLNPFGESPMWLAESNGRLAGFRAMMRWRFVSPTGEPKRAVRAVDTATLPEFQGRGIFRRLTTGAIDALSAEGVHFVFNTPNAMSRPGYLKMGWTEVGRPGISARPTALRRLPALRGARTAADKWSLPCSAGVDANEGFGDTAAITALLATIEPPTGYRTDHDAASLRWRYGLDELRYRVVPVSADTAEGMAVLRRRRRGTAIECVIAQLFVPEPAALGPLLRTVRRSVDADYLLASDRRLLRHGFLPVPGQGPALTTRSLAAPGPGLDDFDFSLGDLELF